MQHNARSGQKEGIMKQHIYSVRDSKAELFNVPFYSNTHAEAERSFRTAVNDSKTTLNRFPEDFDLWYLGEYDTITGQIKALQTPQHMLKAVQCLASQNASVPPELVQLNQ